MKYIVLALYILPFLIIFIIFVELLFYLKNYLLNMKYT